MATAEAGIYRTVLDPEEWEAWGAAADEEEDEDGEDGEDSEDGDEYLAVRCARARSPFKLAFVLSLVARGWGGAEARAWRPASASFLFISAVIDFFIFRCFALLTKTSRAGGRRCVKVRGGAEAAAGGRLELEEWQWRRRRRRRGRRCRRRGVRQLVPAFLGVGPA